MIQPILIEVLDQKSVHNKLLKNLHCTTNFISSIAARARGAKYCNEVEGSQLIYWSSYEKCTNYKTGTAKGGDMRAKKWERDMCNFQK